MSYEPVCPSKGGRGMAYELASPGRGVVSAHSSSKEVGVASEARRLSNVGVNTVPAKEVFCRTNHFPVLNTDTTSIKTQTAKWIFKMALRHSFIQRALSCHVEPLTPSFICRIISKGATRLNSSLVIRADEMLQQQDRLEIDRWCYWCLSSIRIKSVLLGALQYYLDNALMMLAGTFNPH